MWLLVVLSFYGERTHSIELHYYKTESQCVAEAEKRADEIDVQVSCQPVKELK